jgi:D-sedoheptulose 7-phosphate isomerase
MIEGYTKVLQEVRQSAIEEFVRRINKDGRVFIMGNGGSATTSNHLASDLQAIGLRAMSLCANVAILTRLGNDRGYHNVFSAQLEEQYLATGETVIFISASGNSWNLINAVEYANFKQSVTLALTGFGGGELRKLVDYSITLSSCDYGEVEGVHSCLCHLIPSLIKRER